MNTNKVSILIPFKNTEVFLPECIESIIKQTYPHWEILAIDDHSWDNSAQIMLDYAQIEPRIRVYKNKGEGIIEALRTAYAMATGSFITRMDSDDIMALNRLEIMTQSLQKRGEGHIALGKVNYFSDSGLGKGYKSYESWLNGLTEKGANYSEIYKECVIPSPCWMVHRSDLDLVESFVPNRYPEDYDLAFRFYQHNIKCIPTTAILHFWRDYDHRTSRTHEHYAENNFLDLKLSYFLQLDHDALRPLVVWGAGKKGKKIANNLIDKNVDFLWVCDNLNKIDRDIYGKTMQHYKIVASLKNPQFILTVANKEAQKFIGKYLTELKKSPSKDYFFFC
ncbi:Undecaprenyl-phosphate 4-deoxy-4-formamido-L-arabinose transferase [Arenibacter antarcticus]|uniref:Glycosyltransferase family 2 protein n=1 Tax=Arenibacter antarcticus TaxID=2040469 RepID=A0ABW5VFA7_9FLAO|nr:glycosyltransferase family 2 protein [Arenibacter sp. H213]MCM4166191.1 glycosyl transferase family 2 [Arenibacter sp. H213]